MSQYDAVVLHSGGFDSSLALFLAVNKYGKDKVVSFGISYDQRHSTELKAAEDICAFLHVHRVVYTMNPLPGWEASSLVNISIEIKKEEGQANSFVPGRNGLFMMCAAPFIKAFKAKELYVGVMEEDGKLSGYPDCSEEYVHLVEQVIQKDLCDSSFHIIAPLVALNKEKAMELAYEEGVLEPLLMKTISCYQGVPFTGCKTCPSCILRNNALHSFYSRRPSLKPPY